MEKDYNQIASELSHACLEAVVTYAGGTCTREGRANDNKGFDATVRFMGELSDLSGSLTYVQLHVQLKATYSCVIDENDEIAYDIDAAQYNKYIEYDLPGSPMLIVLLLLPPREDFEEWLKLDANGLVMKKCLYWMRLPNEHTENRSSKRIRFSALNILSPENLKNQIVIPIAEGRF